MLFARRVKLADVVPVQCPHDADAGEHGGAPSRHQHQRLDRCLPFRQGGFLLRETGYVVGGVPQGNQRAIGRLLGNGIGPVMGGSSLPADARVSGARLRIASAAFWKAAAASSSAFGG